MEFLKLVNKLPFIIALILIIISCRNNAPVVMIDYPQYQVKEGSIYDGDTLRLIGNQGDELKVRFACTDAPEVQMKHGVPSRDYLRSLLASVVDTPYLAYRLKVGILVSQILN